MRPIVTDSEITEQRPHAAPLGNAAPTNLMARGTNGAATIIGNSRQNLGNLECWGVGVEWWGWGGVVIGGRSSRSGDQFPYGRAWWSWRIISRVYQATPRPPPTKRHTRGQKRRNASYLPRRDL